MNTDSHVWETICVALIIGITVWSGGCRASHQEGTGPYNSEAARETLVAALNAWKSGDTTPLGMLPVPVRLIDDDLAAGLLLVDYQLVPPNQAIRPYVNIRVDLNLRTENGRSVPRQATYQITLQPTRSVMRSDQ